MWDQKSSAACTVWYSSWHLVSWCWSCWRRCGSLFLTCSAVTHSNCTKSQRVLCRCAQNLPSHQRDETENIVSILGHACGPTVWHQRDPMWAANRKVASTEPWGIPQVTSRDLLKVAWLTQTNWERPNKKNWHTNWENAVEGFRVTHGISDLRRLSWFRLSMQRETYVNWQRRPAILK